MAPFWSESSSSLALHARAGEGADDKRTKKKKKKREKSDEEIPGAATQAVEHLP